MSMSLLRWKQTRILFILVFDYVSSEFIFPKFEPKTAKCTGLLAPEKHNHNVYQKFTNRNFISCFSSAFQTKKMVGLYIFMDL